jgi:threonine dehydrogenase-like Zn-dependent dehydrogenase
MALNVGAKVIEKVLGHDDKNRDATTDISNPARDNNKYADPSGEKMKALAWYGKGDVRVIEAPKPALVDDNDIIVKVTGSTVCGSDVHLLHAQILQIEKGDILGHEFIGEVEQVGPGVKDLKVGDRVVNSFCISCGKCKYCKEGLTTMCDNTNASSFHQWMYGDKLAGVFGYSHVSMPSPAP